MAKNNLGQKFLWVKKIGSDFFVGQKKIGSAYCLGQILFLYVLYVLCAAVLITVDLTEQQQHKSLTGGVGWLVG